MIAALPMYDRPENRSAHDALWALIRDGLRARGIEAPDELDRQTPYDEGWAAPTSCWARSATCPGAPASATG
jgi:hypothetical protein